MPGKRCTVATCTNSLQKTKLEGKSTIYHAFPSDDERRKQWIHRCRRAGSWNPSSCHVCSEHFSEEDYDRDLQHELLGLPPRKKLKTTAVPHLNLGNLSELVIDSDRQTRRISRENKQTVAELLSLESIISDQNTSSENNACEMCVRLKEQHDALDCKVCKLEQIIAEQAEKISLLGNEVKNLNAKIILKEQELKRLSDEFANRTKLLTDEKFQFAEEKMGKVLTKTQCDIVLHGKHKVVWQTEDLSRAFTLRYLGQRGYNFLRNKLNYPLPAPSTLRHWASRINMRQGLLHDVLQFMKIGAVNFSEDQRLTVLLFDEMKVSVS